VHQVCFSLHDDIKMHDQQNIKRRLIPWFDVCGLTYFRRRFGDLRSMPGGVVGRLLKGKMEII
jgi:hypothetical protein